MPDEFDVSSISKLGNLIKQHLTVLSHDIVNLQNSVKNIELRLTGLAEREDISKIEDQIDRLASEKLLLVRKEEFSEIKSQVALLNVDKEFLNGVRGTIGFIKVLITAVGGVAVLFIGALIGLHQQSMVIISDISSRVTKDESQIPLLMEFKKEVEEQGSPILRGVIKDIESLKIEIKEDKAEVRALSNIFLEEDRNRNRPDVEDAKH